MRAAQDEISALEQQLMVMRSVDAEQAKWASEIPKGTAAQRDQTAALREQFIALRDGLQCWDQVNAIEDAYLANLASSEDFQLGDLLGSVGLSGISSAIGHLLYPGAGNVETAPAEDRHAAYPVG